MSRKPIADFCGAALSTVGYWFNNGVIPAGESQLKMMFFLSLQGYRVRELSRMSDEIRNYAELIAFGLMTSAEAAQELSYTDTSRIYQLIRGEHAPLPDKAEKMYATWKERREQLERKKTEARKRFYIDLSSEQEVGSVRGIDSDFQSIQDSQSSRVSHANPYVTLLLRLMTVLLHSLDEGNGDVRFHDLDSENQQMVLRLSARLNGLSAGIISGHSSHG